jgi:CRISPR system Cascade subunit CasA
MKIYNLLNEKWIPVRRQSGTIEFIAPHEVVNNFAKDPIIDLAAPRPDFNGALIQFLIGLVQTAFAPKDPREWRKYRDTNPSENELKEAFQKFEFAFNLNGDGPRFMQDFDRGWSSDAKPVGINRLLIDAPGEQSEKFNKDFFVKRPIENENYSLSLLATSAALYALQINAPSGGAGHRTSARGGGPLTTIVKGVTLWGDIWNNVLELSAFDCQQRPNSDDAITIFPWLSSTKSSTQDEKVEPHDCHPFHVYWTMPRRIILCLNTDKIQCAVYSSTTFVEGCATFLTKNYGNNYSENWIHPLTPYRQLKKQETLVSKKAPGTSIGFRYWLELTTIQQGHIRSKVVERFDRNGIGASRIHCFGYSMDNMKPLKWVDTILPLYTIEESNLLNYSIELAGLVEAAEKIRSYVSYAVGLAYGSNGNPTEPSSNFNNMIEPRFYELANNFATNALQATTDQKVDWHSLLLASAYKVFDEYFLLGNWVGIDIGKVFAARSALKAVMNKNKASIQKILNLPLTDQEVVKKSTNKKSKVKTEVITDGI